MVAKYKRVKNPYSKPITKITMFTPELGAAFIRELRVRGNVNRAAKAIGIGDTEVLYSHRKSDKAFGDAWAEAIECSADLLEDEAIRRGVDGVDEPVYHHGEVCGHIKRYSDGMLSILLKATRPSKYRDNVNVTGQQTITIDEDDLRAKVEARIKFLASEKVKK